MRFKLPKTVFICGRTFEIRNSSKVPLAICDVDPNVISINLKRHHSTYELENSLLHECFELVLLLSASLYLAHIDKAKTMFMFSHDTFQHVIIPEYLSIIQQVKFGKIVTPKSSRKRKRKEGASKNVRKKT